MQKFVLFDFDGVIADSFENAFEVNQKFTPGLTRDQMRSRFLGNINESWEKENGRQATAADDKEFFDAYVPALFRSPIVPGILLALESLAKRYTLIIISSTISSPIREYLESHGAASYFTEIMGNDVHRSKVEKIKMVFNKYSATANNCVFVTDTVGDIREAEKAGIKSIAVSWGFHGKDMFLEAAPFAVIDSPAELPGATEKALGE